MKKLALAAVLSIAFAAPAMAGTLSYEVRGGDYVGQGFADPVAGVVVGEDFDLAQHTFVGANVAADKILASGSHVMFTANARAGVNFDQGNRFYGFAGYATTPCATCVGGADLGAGFEHNFTAGIYGKVEYARYLDKGVADANQYRAAVGIRF